MFDSITESGMSVGRKALLDGWGGRPNIVIKKARGAKMWDVNGKEYLVCESQAFALSIGAQHPRVVEAVRKQAEELSHTAYNIDNIPLLLLSRRLTELSPGNLNKVNFCLEGSLAVEGAMKLAVKNSSNRRYFVSMDHGYHGRTLMTMSASWKHPYIAEYISFIENVIKVPEAYCYRCAFNLDCRDCQYLCVDHLEHTLKNRVPGGAVAVIVEPIQGNGGQISFLKEYHQKVREVCSRNGVLLIYDEVQTGFGRTGKIFASELYDVVPDIMTFGKAIAGGYPLAGFLASDELRPFDPGEHAFTFAHFPISMAAALATLEVIEEENLLEKCVETGRYITSRLSEMQEKYPVIGDIRGPGLAIGIELVKDRGTKEPAVEEANKVLAEGLEKGVVFGVSHYGGLGHILKIKPPLVISDEEVEKALEVFETCIKHVS
jgi:4-aminobutyrate aminotransferase-like enzyme